MTQLKLVSGAALTGCTTSDRVGRRGRRQRVGGRTRATVSYFNGSQRRSSRRPTISRGFHWQIFHSLVRTSLLRRWLLRRFPLGGVHRHGHGFQIIIIAVQPVASSAAAVVVNTVILLLGRFVVAEVVSAEQGTSLLALVAGVYCFFTHF